MSFVYQQNAKSISSLSSLNGDTVNIKTTEFYEQFRNSTLETAINAIQKEYPSKLILIDEFIKTEPWLNFDEDALNEILDKNVAESRYANLGILDNEIKRIARLLRKELEEFVKTSSSIKLFIEMNIPKIEDGNNFGVAVQESILSQLSRIIDNAMKLSESSTRFWAYRGKLVSKVLCDEVLKYPSIVDYKEAIVLNTTKQFWNLKMDFYFLRNNYASYYDLVIKNLEKVLKPKTNIPSNMY